MKYFVIIDFMLLLISVR